MFPVMSADSDYQATVVAGIVWNESDRGTPGIRSSTLVAVEPTCVSARERDHVDRSGYPARDSAVVNSEYAEIVRTHERAVWITASRICGNDRASDVVQDVFLKYWTSPEKYDSSRGT